MILTSSVLEKPPPPDCFAVFWPQDPAWNKWFEHLFIGGCRPTATNQKLRSDGAREKPKCTKNENYLRRVSQGGSLFPCSLPKLPYVPMFPQALSERFRTVIFQILFPCSQNLANVPLFPKTPGRPSLNGQIHSLKFFGLLGSRFWDVTQRSPAGKIITDKCMGKLNFRPHGMVPRPCEPLPPENF